MPIGLRLASCLVGTALFSGVLGSGLAQADEVATTPPAPVVTEAVAGDEKAAISWLPAASVTSWIVTAQPGGETTSVPPDAHSAVLGGLTNGAAYAFTVTSRNNSGSSSTSTGPIVPRQPSALALVGPLTTHVVYGTRTSITGLLTGRTGAPLPQLLVQLVGQRAGASQRSVLARAYTDSQGRAHFAVPLSGSSALRVQHLADAATASDLPVGSVSVAPRVTAAPNSHGPAVGNVVAIRGAISPARSGAVMVLQSYGQNRWTSITAVKTGTTGAYVLRWRARSARPIRMRVVTAATSDLTYGLSPRFDVRPHDTVASLAQAILANRRITLAQVHDSGVRDLADPWHELRDLAAGGLVHRSAYDGAPGGRVAVDIRVLRAIVTLSRVASFTISELAGGSHAGSSTHYSGRAVDFNVVNGAAVSGGSGYGVAVSVCRSMGAVNVFSPDYDPYGGHGNHVHCDWGKS